VSEYSTIYVGIDSHKDFNSIAYAPDDRTAEVIFVGRIGTLQRDIDKMVRRMQSKAKQVVFAYEAGPCGYTLYRYLSKRVMSVRWLLRHSFHARREIESRQILAMRFSWPG